MLRFFSLILLTLSFGGCTTLFRPLNQPLEKNTSSNGYYFQHAHHGDTGENVVLLAFSGGGTRAAALAYSVLKELRDTSILAKGQRVPLLNEVDAISSVSGGSFTAAYYGLFGEKIFTDYENVFLKQSIQEILIQNLFDPVYWWRSISTGLDRTELAIEYYDNNIFNGKSFRDIDLAHRPFIEINATNLGTGTRFSFAQVYFDLLCSNLLDLKVARAVAASSAVPIMFPPVVLKNYAGECDNSNNPIIHNLLTDKDEGPRMNEIKQRISHYQNRDKHPYVQLLDGGIVDNLGLRAMADRLQGFQSNFAAVIARNKIKNIVVIEVNAETRPVHNVDETPDKPSIPETIEAFSNVQFRLLNNESRILLASRLAELQERLSANGEKVNVYSATVAFENVAGNALKDQLNSIPTSLELPENEVDLLIRIGGDLLRQDPQYRAYLRQVEGRKESDPGTQVAPSSNGQTVHTAEKTASKGPDSGS